MKKHLTWLMAAVLLTGMATSCSDDEPAPAASDGTVTFTLALPAGIGSRAYSDGLTATKLTYAVYDASAAAGTAPVIFNQEKTFTDKQTTVELKLVTGRTYDILFWADSYGSDAANSPYTFSPTDQTITVDYAKFNSNSDNYDAFFAARTALKVAGPVDETITLTRPFAQVNFGTDDFGTDAVKDIASNIKTAVTVKAGGIFTTLNLKDGTVGGATTADVTFAAVAPATTETFPYTAANGTTYTYLSMDYLLVDAIDDKGLADLTLTAYNGDDAMNAIPVPNAPVRRNYRTNIYGTLLTSTASFNVVIEPAYTASFDKNYIAEGVNKIDDATYELTSSNGLVWLAQQANAEVARAAAEFITDNGTRAFKGITIQLANDIDMANVGFTPICPSTDRYFAGTFDGQGHTISNLTASSFVKGNACAGLFGSIVGTVKSVNLTNVNISSSHYAGGVVGYSTTNGCTVEACSVAGGTITSKVELVDGTYDNGDKVGGIIGYCVSGDKVSGCSVSDVTISGYRDLGGIAGCAGGTVTNNTVSNVTINQDNSCAYKANSDNKNIGEIIGRLFDGLAEIDASNTSSSVTINNTSETVATIITELADGKDVTLTSDITTTALNSSGYSGTAIWHPNGGTLDGGGHTLTVTKANDTWGSAIATKGGTIKNINVVGAFRGIFIVQPTQDVYVENVDVSPGAYPIHCDGGNADVTVYVSNSTLRGWTSYTSLLKLVKFTDCKFESNGSYAYMRPYAETTLTNCTFSEGFGFDVNATQKTITFSNCKVGDTVITADNYSTLLALEAPAKYDNLKFE